MVKQQRAEWGSGLPKRKDSKADAWPKPTLTKLAKAESDEDFDSILKRAALSKGVPDIVKEIAKAKQEEIPNKPSQVRRPQKGARDVRSELREQAAAAKKAIPSIARLRSQLQSDRYIGGGSSSPC